MNRHTARAVHTSPKNGLFHVGTGYLIALCIASFAVMYSFLALQSVQLSRAEPKQSDLTAALKTVDMPVVDQDVVTKIQQLQDNSVSVQALFTQARTSPFQE